MSHHRCCKCGGGGGTGVCCVCWDKYFDPPTVDGTSPGASTLDLNGVLASTCCRPQGPRAPCSLLQFFTPHASDSFPEMPVGGLTSCDISFGDGRSYVDAYLICGGDEFDYTWSTGLNGWTNLVSAGDGTCHQFRLPSSGAIIRAGDTEAEVLIWAGGNPTGALCFMEQSRDIMSEGGKSLSPSFYFAVVDANGKAAGMTYIRLNCVGPVDLNGCTANHDTCTGRPIRIAGGMEITGNLGSDGTAWSNASGSFAYQSVCESEGAACYAERVGDEWCYGFPVVYSGETSGTMSASTMARLGQWLVPCPGGRASGGGGVVSRDTGSSIGDDDAEDHRIIVPDEWLARSPTFAAAIAMLRRYFEPDLGQGPPPGGLGPAGDPNAAAIDAANSRDPMRRCHTCGG